MNGILYDDIDEIARRCSEYAECFLNKSFLITGATGLVGFLLVNSLLRMNDKYDANIHIIVTTRDKNRAAEQFDGLDVLIYNNDEPIKETIDYIIHCASPTQSKIYVENPVETMDAIIFGTRKMLELAKEKQVKKFIYISSMEAYGTISQNDKVSENELGFIPLDSARSSYPEGKRTAELYTYVFAKEFGVPTVSARLAMCFGAGIRKGDNRVHKSFCENALSGQNIIMKSSGETMVNFVYSVDAVVALLTLSAKGEDGEVYNVCGDSHGETILDMAKIVAEIGGVDVVREKSTEEKRFAPDNRMILSNDKMRSLGWEPVFDLRDSLKRLFYYLKQEKE